jgi:hypothetical protein
MRRTAIVIALAAGLNAKGAVAQTLEAGASPEPEDVRALDVEAGTACFLREDYECARGAFGRAYVGDRGPAEIALKLALAELQTGHPVETVDHLQAFLAHAEEPETKREAVRAKWLPRAEAQIARLNVTAPAGAELQVDGVAQGRGPALSVPIAAGDHEVTCVLGTMVETQPIAAGGGELVEVHFQRVPDAVAIPVRSGERPAVAGHSPAKWIAVGGLAAAAMAAGGVGTYLELSPAAGSTAARTAADASYVAAGVFGLASLGALLLWPVAKAKVGSATVTPLVGDRAGGLDVCGVW